MDRTLKKIGLGKVARTERGSQTRQESGPPEEPGAGKDSTVGQVLEEGSWMRMRPHMVHDTSNQWC
jgi:hypothetical protein